jgi:class 3 adenylate cyclase
MSKKSSAQQGISRVYRFLTKRTAEATKNSSKFCCDLPFLEEFTDQLNLVLNSTEEEQLLKILLNFGWDEQQRCFKNTNVDVEGLKIALSKKSRLLFMRASHDATVNSTRCFVPDILSKHLLEINADELAPVSLTVHGVCLLVDISGFTRLSGSYCEQGKNGIDGLQLATNGFLGQMVEVVYIHGGDIIKFAGDALICLFTNSNTKVKSKPHIATIKEENEDFDDNASDQVTLCSVDNETVGCAEECELTTSTEAPHECDPNDVMYMKAMLCAAAVRQICTDMLTVHVGMSCGDLCFGVLGGHDNRWDCLISGPCLFELAQCLDDAASKQAVVSQEFYKKLSPKCLSKTTLTELPSGNYLLEDFNMDVVKSVFDGFTDSPQSLAEACRDPEFQSNLSKFVPVPVLAGLSNGGLRLLSEIREVTTMFMKVQVNYIEKQSVVCFHCS